MPVSCDGDHAPSRRATRPRTLTLAAFGRELDRVGQEVEHDLLDARGGRHEADAGGDVGAQA